MCIRDSFCSWRLPRGFAGARPSTAPTVAIAHLNEGDHHVNAWTAFNLLRSTFYVEWHAGGRHSEAWDWIENFVADTNNACSAF